MDYYKGIVPGKDEPKNGGSYVKDTKDAHEKYNFKPELLKLKGFPEGEYCLGFVETKSTSAGKRKEKDSNYFVWGTLIIMGVLIAIAVILWAVFIK